MILVAILLVYLVTVPKVLGLDQYLKIQKKYPLYTMAYIINLKIISLHL